MAISSPFECSSASENWGWIVDCGATQHMTGNAVGVINKRPTQTMVEACDGRLLTVTAVGDIPIQLITHTGETLDTTLKDVKVVPALEHNSLFSADRAVEAGVLFRFSKDDPDMRIAGRTVPLKRDQRGLYRMPIQRVLKADSATDNAAGYATMGARTLDINVFHQRMGRINGADLHMAAKQCGIKLIGELGDCVGCALGKSRRHAIP